MDELSERYGELLQGSYDCVDRIVLNDRLDECAACVDRERMPFETVFRDRATSRPTGCTGGSIQGEGDAELNTSTFLIDRDHVEFARV
ncbi:MAG TPA: DUF6176 family protein [Actinomycetes bacterium]|nr:DUF6176 family protein [Actinomycetes bacterium]